MCIRDRYKAYWSEEPFVHLCGKRFINRTGSKTRIKVYSNQPEVTLYNNGQKVACQRGDRIFTFTLELGEENHLEAEAGKCRDQSLVRRVSRKDPSYKMKRGGSNKSCLLYTSRCV